MGDRVEDLIRAKDAAYKERNALVCALSKVFPSHLMRSSIEVSPRRPWTAAQPVSPDFTL